MPQLRHVGDICPEGNTGSKKLWSNFGSTYEPVVAVQNNLYMESAETPAPAAVQEKKGHSTASVVGKVIGACVVTALAVSAVAAILFLIL